MLCPSSASSHTILPSSACTPPSSRCARSLLLSLREGISDPLISQNTFDKALGLASQGQAALAALGVGYGLFKSATGSSGATTPPSAPMSSTSASTSRSADKEETEVAPTAEKPAVKSSWLSFSTVASIAAAAGAVGAAGAAYYNRETIQQHVNWATSHLSFVGELWKTTELEKRTQELVQASEKGVGFHW